MDSQVKRIYLKNRSLVISNLSRERFKTKRKKFFVDIVQVSMVEPHHNHYISVDPAYTTAAGLIPASLPPSVTVASVRHDRFPPPPSATVASVCRWSHRPPRPLHLGRLRPPRAIPSTAAALPLSPPSDDGIVPSATAASIRRGSRRPLRPPPSSHGRLHPPRKLHLPWLSPTVSIRHIHIHLHSTRELSPATAVSIRGNEQEGNQPSRGVGRDKIMPVTEFECQHLFLTICCFVHLQERVRGHRTL